MLRLASFIYNMGRRKGYSEAIVELEHLQTTITRSREGTIVRRQVIETIDKLKRAQKDDEASL